MTRGKVLNDAITATKEREGEFGSPQENLGLVADLWTQYIKTIKPHYEIEAKDVAMMMVLFKVSRMASGAMNRADYDAPPSHDTLVDIAGYAAIASELEH
tara:strand:- start:38 stop:337 length:300 start_codon:yes stop_codon:yes gene_type:complete